MTEYTESDLEIFAESTRRVNEGFKNMRDKNTPPRPSEFLGFSNPRNITNLPEKAKEYFSRKRD